VDERRARIHDDLRGLVAGDLLFDPVGRSCYAHDASLYEIEPLGVVVPRSTADLVAVVRYAAEHGLPLHARGAGTGLAGESLGPGLVVDFSRYFRRVLEVRPESVVVEPGVVLDVLNAQLLPLGRRIGPDPSGSATCTIGGMIAGDASGARSLRYGTTADAVESLDVVFANGEAATLGLEPWPDPERAPSDFKGVVARRLALHLNWHADLIARKAPAASRNRAGYALGAVAKPGGIDLARLMVGSEGTLALVTRATLRTVSIPAMQGVVLLLFGRLTDAAEAVRDCLDERPTACELVDWRRLNLAREAEPLLRPWFPEAAEAALVVEFEGNEPAIVERACHALSRRMRRHRSLVAEPIESTRRADCERLMGLRDLIAPMLLRARGRKVAVPLIEDVAVPPATLPEFLQRLQQILKAHEVNWTFHAHAGVGQTHTRPFLDLSDPADAAKIEPLAAAVYEVALALGGTISGEHGCGLVRSQFIRRQYGELANVFREIKYAFDPHNLLNPGKIVADDPHLMLRDLRGRLPVGQDGRPGQGALPVLNAPLRWEGRDRAEQIAACNGCGDCRTTEPSLRMCPTFRGQRGEPASPRAQVNLLRQIASGRLDPRLWGSEQLRANADLCVHCNLCRTECPAGIDVSSLMVEAKAAYVENHGLSQSDRTFSHVDLWARWGSRLPFLTNALLGSRRARWLIERFFGLARHRVVPRVQRGSFLRRAERLGLTRPRPHEPGPRVAYFVDVFANHFDQELAEAVVGVLRYAGVNVYVPKRQRGCGMPALVAGDLDRARALVDANLRVLGDAVRDGYTVVCSEPTAALMLKQESLRLTDDLDAALVAANTMDVGQYLAGLAGRGSLPRPEGPLLAKVGYHQPCHLRALNVGAPGLDLIRMIPELDVEFIDRGCSGIAGIHGLARRNFRNSLRAGRALRSRLKDADIEIGATECGTCRMQMEQGISKRTLHPIKLLSLSYGLNPELRRRFKDPKPPHVIS
jgi:FAD/FMN-containing dehydrogenase/Fe-S oxidoreductase